MRNEISLYRNWLKCNRMKLRRAGNSISVNYRIRCTNHISERSVFNSVHPCWTYTLRETLLIPASQDTYFKFELSPNCVTGNRQLLLVISLITTEDTSLRDTYCRNISSAVQPSIVSHSDSISGPPQRCSLPPEYFGGIAQKQRPRGRGARNSTVQPWVRQINQVIRDNLLEKLKLKIKEAPSNSEPLIFLV